ncbi:MAG: hypothetical protein ACREPI_05845 [Candidatus Dormibacterales bacterium]
MFIVGVVVLVSLTRGGTRYASLAILLVAFLVVCALTGESPGGPSD